MKHSMVISLLLAMLAATPIGLAAQNKAWATLSNGVLTFSYGAKPKAPSQVKCNGCGRNVSSSSNFCSNCGAKIVKAFWVFDASANVADPTGGKWPLWRQAIYKGEFEEEYITKVVFQASFKQATNIRSTRHWFHWLSNLTEIVGLEYLNTANVTDMSHMFEGCEKLRRINLSNFNTQNVTNMNALFSGCKSLTSIDVSRFNTSKVTDMGAMFCMCTKITQINVSNFDTRNVINMYDMFSWCEGLTTINLSNFNTSKVTEMERMFCACTNLKSVNVSKFNTSKVKRFCSMFDGCKSLTTLDISNFVVKNAFCDHMFGDCVKLKTVYVSSQNWKPKVGDSAYGENILMYNCNASFVKK